MCFSDILFQVLSSNDVRYGYNAAKNCYEDLMAAGILDPTKVFQKLEQLMVAAFFIFFNNFKEVFFLPVMSIVMLMRSSIYSMCEEIFKN